MDVRYTTQFNRDLSGIRDRQLARIVEQVIEDLKAAARLTEISGVSRLTNVGSRYRIRIGNYRLVILMRGNEVTLEMFLHRREVYRRRGRG